MGYCLLSIFGNYAITICDIDLHVRNPLSDIPHDSYALRIRRDDAKGTHVVILILLDAFSVCIMVHVRNPSSDIPHVQDAFKIWRVVANGAHVVIFSLLHTYNFWINVHDCTLASDIPHVPCADKMRTVCAHVVIRLFLPTISPSLRL